MHSLAHSWQMARSPNLPYAPVLQDGTGMRTNLAGANVTVGVSQAASWSLGYLVSDKAPASRTYSVVDSTESKSSSEKFSYKFVGSFGMGWGVNSSFEQGHLFLQALGCLAIVESREFFIFIGFSHLRPKTC